jgi:hypothetical protein
MKAFLVDLENKPGELARIAEALGNKGVNISSVSGTSCGTGGRVALLTADEASTRSIFGDINCKYDEVEAVEASMAHEPGTLGKTARRLADAGVNIEAIIPMGMTGRDVSVAFATDNPTKAREVLATSTSSMR